ncbi:MAG: ferritin-like domain-containing protein [Vicinamibacterales bacterium]
MKTLEADAIIARATPRAHQQARRIQPFGHLVRMPLALSENACRESVESLNQLLADTITLRDLYKKHHWQVAGPTFYQLHLLFDKHAGEQSGDRRHDCRADSAPRRCQPRNGPRHRGGDARAASSQGT